MQALTTTFTHVSVWDANSLVRPTPLMDHYFTFTYRELLGEEQAITISIYSQPSMKCKSTIGPCI